MAKNVFTTFLEAMKVKYTSSFSNKLFEEHPYKYTCLLYTSDAADEL